MTNDGLELFDVNVLIALTLRQHVHHRRAIEHLAVTHRWATSPITEAGWLRLLMNPSVSGRPVPAIEALRAIGSFRTRSEWNFVPDDASLSAPQIDVSVLVGAKQVTDFHLVELAAGVGARLTSFDARLRDALAPADRHHVRVLTA